MAAAESAPTPASRRDGVGFSKSRRQEKPPNTCWRQDTLMARGRTPRLTSDFGTAALITRLPSIRTVAHINRQSLVLVLVHLLSQCCCATYTNRTERIVQHGITQVFPPSLNP